MYKDFKNKMAPTIKLTYFNARGRGEISRLVFAYGGIAYEDNRIEFSEWPALKAKTPFGGLPVLEVDGEMFGQGIAINAYAAQAAGCYGASPLEKLKIDSVALAREDMLTAITKWHFEQDEEKKKVEGGKLFGEIIPMYLEKFNQFVKENPKKSGYMVGSKLSLADIVMVEATQMLVEQDAGALDKYPELKALREKVVNTKGIKDYMAKRPKTDF